MCFQGRSRSSRRRSSPAPSSSACASRRYLVFICLWALLVYSPLCHWVWGGGWLADMGALDFAGGTVVHVNAGAAALVAAIVVGKRKDYPGSGLLPHNVPFTLLGAGLLWFGWFGFNAGSALAANGHRGPRVHHHDAGARGDAGRVDHPGSRSGSRSRRRSAPRRRSSSAWSPSPRGRLRRADERDRARRDRRDSELLRAGPPRQVEPGRLARRRRGARRRRHGRARF